MAKRGIVSCQITYLPIGTVDYPDEVNDVLEIIKESGLEYNVDIMSTTIRGESDIVFNLIKKIHSEMSGKNYNFTMNILLSNICGCGE
ncbi:MAG: thiamine-binding protein [Firmicutes bacterium]|nr:thiamine-binding protein [Bacillota bacterium]